MSKHLLFSKKIFFLFAVFFLSIDVLSSQSFASDPRDSVVKVLVTSNRIDYYRPWQMQGMSMSSGSGAIIDGHKILTNAHVVSNQTFIQVKKRGDPKRYTARLESVANDCDLALLTVDDLEFFKETVPFKLGGLPKLQDNVTVMGYPQGGGKLSITQGVVSRVELTHYSQSSRKLLTVQIDAAINSGNSGGPVLQNNKIVGVAMQVLQSGQNIGYMIPVPIIKHYFDDLKDGHYDGFPVLGIDYRGTENKSLRKFYQLDEYSGGVLVSKVLPFYPAENLIKEGDIILKINDVAIGTDGTFTFRDKERLTLPYLITKAQVDENIVLDIVRKGELKKIILQLGVLKALIPGPHYFKEPPYFIYGGLVFTVLSADLMKSWGNKWWEKGPIDFNHYVIGSGRTNSARNKDVVVLLDVLTAEVNVGYSDYDNSIIVEVNGKEFSSFKEFVGLLTQGSKGNPFTILTGQNSQVIILDNKLVLQDSERILKRNAIPQPFSGEVEKWLRK